MKIKRVLSFILSVAVAVSMAGCSGKDSSDVSAAAASSATTTTTTSAATTTTTTATTTTTEAQEELPPEPVGNVNILTGEYTLPDEAVGKRPVAVMVNNITFALPQYGVAQADMIYECPVEGGITRLMAIYGDITSIPDVCSVRSCRYYYPIFALSYDAVYCFWGKDETIAKETLNKLDVDRLDGYSNGFIFDRDAERDKTYSSEHTGYFKGSVILEALERSAIRSDLLEGKDKPVFNFSQEDVALSDEACKKLCVYFSEAYYSDFVFDSKTGVYKKYHNGKKHMDCKTETQLEFTNLFILETDTSVINWNNGLISLDWTGGDGYYVSMGTVIPVKWSKADEFADLVITNADGSELTVNTGKSYFGFTTNLKSNFKIK